MLINIKSGAPTGTIKQTLAGMGLWLDALLDESGDVSGFFVKGYSTPVDAGAIRCIEGVASVHEAKSPHPVLDRHRQSDVCVSDIDFMSDTPVLIAGPCSVDSEERIDQIAYHVAQAGGRFLRGGAYKPRTSPYAFAGFGVPALKWMRTAADRHGLGVITEVMSEHDVDTVADIADVVQIGSRNMQNFALLRQAGATGKPALLKRGRAATVSEWLMAAEYLYASGTSCVLFCERGIRGFDGHTRNLIDLGAVALLRHHYGLPVVVDPSHAAGRRDLVAPLACAAVAAGATGVMVETHPEPELALSDAPQALSPAALNQLAAALNLEVVK